MEQQATQWHGRAWDWFVRHAQSRHAVAWLALVAFADAIFFPVATELFLIALTLAQPSRWRTFLTVSIGTSTVGAAVGYLIARLLFDQFGAPILALYHLEPAFHLARHYIAGHVFWTMAVASFTPVPDKVFIYAGGFLHVRFLPFIAGYFLGRGVRMALVVYLTGRYGMGVIELLKRYVWITAAAVVILGTLYAMVHWHLLGL